MPGPAHPGVHCRVGSSEKGARSFTARPCVPCRTGSQARPAGLFLRRCSHGPRPHLGRPGRLPSGLQGTPIRCSDVEIFATPQGPRLLRQLLAHVIGFSAELADHHFAHLQLATTAAGKVHPLSIVFEVGNAGEIAQGAWTLDGIWHGNTPVKTVRKKCAEPVVPHRHAPKPSAELGVVRPPSGALAIAHVGNYRPSSAQRAHRATTRPKHSNSLESRWCPWCSAQALSSS